MDPCRQAQLVQNRSKKSSKVKAVGDLDVSTLSHEDAGEAGDVLGSSDDDNDEDDDDAEDDDDDDDDDDDSEEEKSNKKNTMAASKGKTGGKAGKK